MRRIVLGSAILLTAAAALVCVERLLPDERLPRSQTLADGSVFTVEDISFGTNQLYREASPKAWQLAIGQKLPYALAARLGWRFNTGGNYLSIIYPKGMTSLVIFTAREGSGRYPTDKIRVVVLDEQGNGLRSNEGGGSNAGRDKNHAHYHQLQSRNVSAFPRRGKTLLVRFLREQGDGKPDLPIMQFHIANPQPGTYPTWTPEPWPASKDAGDVVLTLTDFTTGLSKSEPTRAAVENEEVVTRLALHLQADGRTNCPWQIRLVEISDATGNRWNSVPYETKTQDDPQGVTHRMTLSGDLWPGEAAWKLRVELAPKPSVPPDEVATLTGIVLPPEGSNAPLFLSTNIGVFSFRLQRIETKKPSFNAKHPTLPVSISYDLGGMPDDCHLSLMKVSDEHGRNVPINGPKELWPMADSFDLAVPTNVVSLNCTFGVRKSRFVEFIAKPRRP